VKVFLPKDVLKQCETPNELIEFIGITNTILKLQECDRNEVHYETNPFIYRRKIALYMYLFNFVMNRVPSDIYRFKNPPLSFDRNYHPDLTSWQ